MNLVFPRSAYRNKKGSVYIHIYMRSLKALTNHLFLDDIVCLFQTGKFENGCQIMRCVVSLLLLLRVYLASPKEQLTSSDDNPLPISLVHFQKGSKLLQARLCTEFNTILLIIYLAGWKARGGRTTLKARNEGRRRGGLLGALRTRNRAVPGR